MSLEEEVEIIAHLHELLQTDDSEVALRIVETDDPYDSPVLVILYNDTLYAIAVEQFPPRENQFT